MRRVVWIWAGVALLLVFGAVGASAGKPSARYNHRVDQRLNVVVILSDDERWDGTTVMQNVKHLLVDHGVNFTNAHVTTSMCGPSRASILTGQYAHHTGVLDNFGTHAYPAFKATEPNDLPVWMHNAGYKTALVGKYINAYTGAAGHHAIPPGWDDWQVMDSIPMEAYYNYSINNNGRLERYGSKPSDYSTTVLTHKAVNFIHGARHPFFLYFAPVTPHLPAIPNKRDRGKLQNIAPIHSPAFNQRNIGKEPWRFWHKGMLSMAAQLYINHVRIKQEESLLALDRSVRSVVQALKDRHELKRTVIVYTSDNGFLWGEHRLGGKVWPYQESTHVPMIVRTPWTRGAQKNNQPVLNIDLAPTISELAGITPSLPEDGRSFVPFLRGEQAPWRHEWLEEFLGKDMLRDGGPPPYVAVQTRRSLYVEFRNGWRELYNLKTDPWELRNIAGSPRTKPLQATLNGALTRLYDTPPTPVVNQHN